MAGAGGRRGGYTDREVAMKPRFVHLVLRPGLPVLAEPAAACTLAEPARAEPPPEALRSELPEDVP